MPKMMRYAATIFLATFMTIMAAATPAAADDLTAMTANAHPDKVHVGKSISVTVTVTNKYHETIDYWPVNAPAPFEDCGQEVGELAPGKTATVKCNGSYDKPGHYKAVFSVKGVSVKSKYDDADATEGNEPAETTEGAEDNEPADVTEGTDENEPADGYAGDKKKKTYAEAKVKIKVEKKKPKPSDTPSPSDPPKDETPSLPTTGSSLGVAAVVGASLVVLGLVLVRRLSSSL